MIVIEGPNGFYVTKDSSCWSQIAWFTAAFIHCPSSCFRFPIKNLDAQCDACRWVALVKNPSFVWLVEDVPSCRDLTNVESTSRDVSHVSRGNALKKKWHTDIEIPHPGLHGMLAILVEDNAVNPDFVSVNQATNFLLSVTAKKIENDPRWMWNSLCIFCQNFGATRPGVSKNCTTSIRARARIRVRVRATATVHKGHGSIPRTLWVHRTIALVDDQGVFFFQSVLCCYLHGCFIVVLAWQVTCTGKTQSLRRFHDFEIVHISGKHFFDVVPVLSLRIWIASFESSREILDRINMTTVALIRALHFASPVLFKVDPAMGFTPLREKRMQLQQDEEKNAYLREKYSAGGTGRASFVYLLRASLAELIRTLPHLPDLPGHSRKKKATHCPFSYL